MGSVIIKGVCGNCSYSVGGIGDNNNGDMETGNTQTNTHKMFKTRTRSRGAAAGDRLQGVRGWEMMLLGVLEMRIKGCDGLLAETKCTERAAAKTNDLSWNYAHAA
jgi:hypothetical protein